MGLSLSLCDVQEPINFDAAACMLQRSAVAPWCLCLCLSVCLSVCTFVSGCFRQLSVTYFVLLAVLARALSVCLCLSVFVCLSVSVCPNYTNGCLIASVCLISRICNKTDPSHFTYIQYIRICNTYIQYIRICIYTYNKYINAYIHTARG